MIWVEITLADVLAHLPTDIKTSYDTWLVSYPDKAGRLATLTDNTIREFRDAIKSNPANVVDPRETFLPQSAVRHVESIIIFNLAMEMGVDLDSAGNSARTSADVFLRQIPYGRAGANGLYRSGVAARCFTDAICLNGLRRMDQTRLDGV
jgi:hypothetical protein